jgi:predicted nucleotidyltransferase
LQREEAYKVAQQCAQFLKERFNVDNVYIFGSVVGDGIWHKYSDIDIAVEGLPADKYFRALCDISEILPSELDLDLVTLETAHNKLKERIIAINDKTGNTKMPENKIDRLKSLIESELSILNEIMQQIEEFLDYASEHGPDMMVKRSIGSCLNDFYNCIEMMFERIAVTFDGNTPEGKEWHKLLLDQMEVDTPNRPAVIGHELAMELFEYLRFRHLFRHLYGGKLDWDKLYTLAIGVSDTLIMSKEQIAYFLNEIQGLDKKIEK